MTLLELAERCEQATGPSRALDQQIELTLPGVLPHPDTEREGYVVDEWAYVISGEGHPDEAPGQGYSSGRYTASLDAAMALVPEGMRDELEITTLYQVARVGINLNHGPDGSPFYASNESNSIPLALCAAALRARGETL